MSVERLAALFDDLSERRRRLALTHSSWTDHRADSYGRLAFLGDSVLGLAVAEEIFSRFPRSDIGRLTKVHGQAVSGRACAGVAFELGVPERLAELAPDGPESIDVPQLLASERAMASITEAVIGACYLEHGYERTAEATIAAFGLEIELATETTLDFKSTLQERLARRGVRVTYAVVDEEGPPHDRRFEVEARVEGEAAGSGSGRSKKEAEQAAAAEALVQFDS
ncbi:MAG: ribonuclease III family protein [Solirubrobacterales bacterium]